MTPKVADVEPPAVSREWQRWAAHALLNGSTLPEVVAMMAATGITEEAAAAACAVIYLDPVYAAADAVAAQYRKVGSMHMIQSQLLDLSPSSRKIERRSSVSRKTFLDNYYAKNQPVILTDVCAKWPALSRWTPEYLGAALRGQQVEVMAGRDSDPDYELNSDEHKQTISFDDYVAQLTSVESSNDTYLVANNQLLDSAGAAPLWEDFALDPRYMSLDRTPGLTFLWLGPKGTITPLHHDVINVMFHQVTGRKRITLISPAETRLVYNSVSVYSDVRLEDPDYDRYPAFAAAHPLTVDLDPGETLFIPVGWWHHVVALDLSASISSTSFRFPNSYEWFHPEPID